MPACRVGATGPGGAGGAAPLPIDLAGVLAAGFAASAFGTGNYSTSMLRYLNATVSINAHPALPSD